MHQPFSAANSSLNSKREKVMTPEQFNQVVEAILSGKYSWACVLILRFAGYNPLHYIPYRTYNRLMKENRPHAHRPNTPPSAGDRSRDPRNSDAQPRKASTISDLAYLDSVKGESLPVRGSGSNQFRTPWG